MGPNRRNTLVFVIVALTLGLAVACGSAVSQRRETPSSLEKTSPAPPSGGVSTTTPQAADLGMSVKTEPGKVSVLLAAPSPREGEKIRATVANGRTQTIYSEDSKTDCSIVILERLAGKTWEPVLGCAVGRAPIVVAIGPSRGRVVTIDPFSFHLRLGTPDTSKPVLRAGTYRIRYAYRLGPGPEFEEPYTAFSPTFQIRR